MAPAQAFPKRARLLRHADFDRVYRQGRRTSSANVSVFYLAASGNEPEDGSAQRRAAGARIGITVSKALGGAVQRNRIKRRVREAVRRHLQEIGAGVDVVINPRKSAGEVEFARLEKEIAGAFAAVARASRRKATEIRDSS